MKKLIIAIVLILPFCKVKSQTQTAVFEDGTKIDYEILEKDGDLRRRMIMGLGFIQYGDVINLLSIDYFEPGKFWVEAKTGLAFAEVNGLVFLNSSEREKVKSIPLRSTYVGANTTLVHVIKNPLNLKKYFGIHAGYAYKDYNSYQFGGGSHGAFNELALGVGMYKVLHTRYRVQAEKKPQKKLGENSLGIFADALFYVGSSGIPSDAESNYETLGYRIYLEGKNTGVTYKLGVMKGPQKDVFIPMFGFGFCWGMLKSRLSK